MNTSYLRILLAVSLSLFCPLIFAHPGHEGSAFSDGILHPLTGPDHLLAMLGIGLWSAQQNSRFRWLIPASFVTLMGLGAWAGTYFHASAWIENGVATSVLLVGLLISFSIRTSLWIGAMVASIFAAFHGFAHGTEMPHSLSALSFGGGFLLSTIFLHAIGFLAGIKLSKNSKLVQAGGAGIALCGGLLILQGLY